MNNNSDVSNNSSVANTGNSGVSTPNQSSGGTQSTSTDNMIPYDRFAEVNAQKRAAELKVQELETERQKLMASQQQGSNVNPADPTTDAEQCLLEETIKCC